MTRERILHAARKVFAESGYEAATFQAIAMEIGLTRPAINNYFPSKSVLYSEVVGRVRTTVCDAVTSASAATTLAEQVLSFLRLTLFEPDPPLAGFLVQSAMHSPPAPQGPEEPQASADIDGFLRGAVAAAVERGEVNPGADADALADALVSLVWGAALQVGRGQPRNGRRAESMLGQLGELLDHGLRQAS